MLKPRKQQEGPEMQTPLRAILVLRRAIAIAVPVICFAMVAVFRQYMITHLNAAGQTQGMYGIFAILSGILGILFCIFFLPALWSSRESASRRQPQNRSSEQTG